MRNISDRFPVLLSQRAHSKLITADTNPTLGGVETGWARVRGFSITGIGKDRTFDLHRRESLMSLTTPSIRIRLAALC